MKFTLKKSHYTSTTKLHYFRKKLFLLLRYHAKKLTYVRYSSTNIFSMFLDSLASLGKSIWTRESIQCNLLRCGMSKSSAKKVIILLQRNKGHATNSATKIGTTLFDHNVSTKFENCRRWLSWWRTRYFCKKALFYTSSHDAISFN